MSQELKTFRPEYGRKTERKHALPEVDELIFAEEIPPCRAFVPGMGPCILSRHGDEIEHTVSVEDA